MLTVSVRDESINCDVFELTMSDDDYNELIENVSDWLYDNESYIEEDCYDDMLDECHDTIELCGIKYAPSNVLYQVDRIAYDMGLKEYRDWIISEAIYELKTSPLSTDIYCGNLTIKMVEC